jgi:hypothetical protein
VEAPGRGARRCPQEYLPSVRSGFDCNIGREENEARVCVWHAPSRLRGARSRHHIGSHIERLKAKAAQSASDGKLEDEVARLKRANQELRTKNRTLTKWAEDEIAKVKKRWAMPRSTFNVIVNCLYPDKAPPSSEERAEACGLVTQWKKGAETRR